MIFANLPPNTKFRLLGMPEYPVLTKPGPTEVLPHPHANAYATALDGHRTLFFVKETEPCSSTNQ